MKRHVQIVPILHAGNGNPRLCARAASAVATLRMTLLALACAAGSGTVNANTPPTAFAIFTVSKSGGTLAGDPVTFNFRTADSTAKAGSDYLAISFTSIPIPANQSSVSIAVPVIGDQLQEFNETFLAQLSNPSF